MSATATVPPPSSSSLLRHAPRLTARARALLTAVNLHYAGVAALLVVVLYMVLHLLFLSQSLKAHNADALSQQRTLLTTARLQAKPLRGLDTKIAASTHDADAFYADRLPYAYSQVLSELGHLTHLHRVLDQVEAIEIHARHDVRGGRPTLGPARRKDHLFTIPFAGERL